MTTSLRFKLINMSFAIFAAIIAFMALALSVSAAEIPVGDFAALKGAVAAASNGDTIIIRDNITFTEAITIDKNLIFRAENKAVLTVASDIRHFNVRKDSGGDVTLEFVNVELVGRKTSDTDTTPGGGIVIVRAASVSDANVTNTINTLYLVNAVIRNCHNTAPNYGGAISFTWVQGQVVVGAYCNIDISGAKTDISHNSSTRGGGISANHITVNDGIISNNTASDRGGGVYAYSGFTMNGGAIINNTAEYGGGIQDYPHGEIAIKGGVVSGNTAAYGGGIHSNAEFITVSGGYIENNHATQNGGGISGNHITVAGGNVRGNTSGGNGGGVYAGSGLVMSSGEISGNGAAVDGGGVYASAWNPDFDLSDTGTFNYHAVYPISGGTISGNAAGRNGAGICAGKPHFDKGDFGLVADVDFVLTLDINGGTIRDNTAAYGGGGIYTESGGANIANSIISGNAAVSRDAGNGGGICAANDSVINTFNTTVSGNTAGLDGGGIWIADLSNFTADNVTFTNNKASKGYIWDIDVPTDEAQATDAVTHKSNTFDTIYTVPFTNAYSNYDVNYASGTLFTESIAPPAVPGDTTQGRIIHGTPRGTAGITGNEAAFGNTGDTIIDEGAVPLAPVPETDPGTGNPNIPAVPVALLLCVGAAFVIKLRD